MNKIAQLKSGAICYTIDRGVAESGHVPACKAGDVSSNLTTASTRPLERTPIPRCAPRAAFCYTRAMPWATRRRFFILLIIGSVVVAFFVAAFYSTLYRAPSCTDSIQNQDESGVDCGGSCAYLCAVSQQPPTVLFTKAFQNSGGRTDIVASIENKNANAAAKDVPYTITLYGSGQSFIQEVSGTVDLVPGLVTPIYVSGIASGKQTVTRAFLAIDPLAPRWFAMTADERRVPTVSTTKFSGVVSSPRIEAVVVNPTMNAFMNVRVIILVRGPKGDVIAASETILPSIPAQGQATAIFTWNSAFPSSPTAIEVVPIIPLPDR